MTALPHRPSVAENLLTATVRVGVPEDRERAAGALGLTPHQLQPVRDGELRADLQVPRGSWHVWPARGAAMWVGDGSPPASASGELEIDVVEGVWRLADAGWLLREGAVATSGGWARPLRGRHAYAALADTEVQALWAVWANPFGGIVRAGIAADGRVWATSARDARAIVMTLMWGDDD